MSGELGRRLSGYCICSANMRIVVQILQSWIWCKLCNSSMPTTQRMQRQENSWKPADQLALHIQQCMIRHSSSKQGKRQGPTLEGLFPRIPIPHSQSYWHMDIREYFLKIPTGWEGYGNSSVGKFAWVWRPKTDSPWNHVKVWVWQHESVIPVPKRLGGS